MLLKKMPRDSALRREVVGEGEDWGRLEYLVAELIDATNAWGWAITGNKQNERPKPIPRPGDRSRTRLSSRQLKARLDALRDKARRR